ncbi:hypothetical protein ACH0B5_15975 [Ureibacillus sp. 179-F W5.1 NHS]|uniref:hypothetical protein n=1 Tax=Ureibacillus sp. 179-F W5.1 NHS TaxID=3374297 RepID=UPI0038796A10
MNKFKVNSIVEEFIDSIALQNIRRLSPIYVANQLNITDVDLVFDALMRLADYKLRVKYEIQCVECGSGDFVLYDRNNLNKELKECRFCHNNYIPDQDKVWITFDITPDFKDSLKESSATYGGESKSFFDYAGYSIKEDRQNPVFSRREDFYSNWSINIERYKELLTEVKIAPMLKQQGKITNRQQGDTLENLIKFLFDGSPTFFDYKGKVVTATSEIDGCTEVLTNEGFLRNWPPYNLNECKNWMSAVDKDSVEAFIGKIRRAMQHTGIIFSRFGITGEDSDQRRAAKSLIYSAATEGIITMIFTLKDLERIQEGENFLNLLAEKYKNTVFINA